MRCSILGVCCVLVLISTGCGSNKSDSGAGSASSGSPGAAAASVSAYDAGPRAGETPINDALVPQGQKLFQEKGCSACHTFGKRMSGPDLDGVTMRRTAQWMEHQILHPEVMTKQDAISRQLFAQFSLQMPNQGLDQDQARAVIEFLKHKNHESRETHEGGER